MTANVATGAENTGTWSGQSNTPRYSINVPGRPQILTGIWRAVQYKEGGELSIDQYVFQHSAAFSIFLTADWLISTVNKE